MKSSQRSRGFEQRREVDSEKYLVALWGTEVRVSTGEPQIRDFGVKAQLDFIMPPWDLEIFELEMGRTIPKTGWQV